MRVGWSSLLSGVALVAVAATSVHAETPAPDAPPMRAKPCDPVTVLFEPDQATVPASAQLALEQLATCLMAAGGSVTIEGHAEERGTPEYALASAERRAKAVAKALGALGVQAGRIRTRSYGQEKPVCTEPTEACRAKNRRAEAIPN